MGRRVVHGGPLLVRHPAPAALIAVTPAVEETDDVSLPVAAMEQCAARGLRHFRRRVAV